MIVTSMKHTKSEPNKMNLALWLLIASVIGLLSSAKLTLEKLSYWQQAASGKLPSLGCDISPIVGCGPVINTPPASIFGDIPNPILGIVGFTALGAIAVLLMAGVPLKKWMWGGLQVGVSFGLGVVTYLQYESIYNLHALCPYCMVVWGTMIVTFWVVTARNLGSFTPTNRIAKAIYNYTPLWIVIHFAVLFLMAWFQFGTTLWA